MIEQSGKQYLSIREFAVKAGKSSQAIYKKVDNQLSTYVILVDNQKYIDKTALFEVFGLAVDNQVDNFSTKVDNQVDNQNQAPESSDVSKELLEMLKEEIAKKDKQIEQLQANLQTAYMQIADMAKKAQYITAADKTERIIQQQSKEDIEVTAAAKNQNTEEKPKRKWYQIFRKK